MLCVQSLHEPLGFEFFPDQAPGQVVFFRFETKIEFSVDVGYRVLQFALARAQCVLVMRTQGNALFEFDPNEFAAWHRARTTQEIRQSYLMRLTGAEPGLAVLYPLSQKEQGFKLTNRSRWTTTIYDSAIDGKPFFTSTGLFFNLVGAFGDHAAITTIEDGKRFRADFNFRF